MTPGGATRVAGVIGDPVVHSLSPAIHNAAFASAGLDWVYVAFPVAPGAGPAAVDAMRTLRLGGLSVTMPHKADVVAAADARSPTVDALGAANCLVPVGDGTVRAENTDGQGFLAGLADDAGIVVRDLRVVVLGAGGAARAVTHACADAGAASVTVVNRSAARAAVCADLAGVVGEVGEPTAVGVADLVVNATPVGMAGDDALPLDPALLHTDQVVVDLVYEPRETPLLRAARERGIAAHNGVSMLVHQAASAFTHWTGLEAPLAAMRAAVETNLA